MNTEESIQELRDEIRKLREELRETGWRVTFVPQPNSIPHYPWPPQPYRVPWYPWSVEPTITWGHPNAAAPQFPGWITYKVVGQ